MSTWKDRARQVKKLLNKLKREGGKVNLRPVQDPMEQLLRGILSTFASESRADVALAKLHAAVVDLNDLRVTPISEMVEIIGVDYPMCRAASEEISRALNAVFNCIHGLDLGFLGTSARRAAESFLNGLDGVGAHAKATVIQRCLKGHVVPLDARMHNYLEKGGYIPAGTSVHAAQRWLTRQIKECDGHSFYVLLKRHAATHAPRKTAAAAPGSGAGGSRPKRAEAAQRRRHEAAKTTVPEKAPRKTTPKKEPSIQGRAETRKKTAVRSASSAGFGARKTKKKGAASPKKTPTRKAKRAVSKSAGSGPAKKTSGRRR